jgi:hypothetical protein
MKRKTEVIYPGHDGTSVLVVARAGVPVNIASPRTSSEALAIAKALQHCAGETTVAPTELAAAPRLRRAWLTDQDRLLLWQDQDCLVVHCYTCDRKEARDLMAALDDALAEPLNPATAAQPQDAGGKAVAA